MSKISEYATVTPASISDMIIGTDVSDLNSTKNFTVGSILALPLQDIGVYADNAAAVTAGLAIGKPYRITGTDHLGIVHA